MLCVCLFLSWFADKEAEKAKERLAQEEAEAMEMEDEENKMENMNNEKEVDGEKNSSFEYKTQNCYDHKSVISEHSLGGYLQCFRNTRPPV